MSEEKPSQTQPSQPQQQAQPPKTPPAPDPGTHKPQQTYVRGDENINLIRKAAK